LRLTHDTRNLIWVGVREDVGEPLIADFEIVQNPSQADGVRRFFMPLWPQPALIPRDPARGARVENIAFKGFEANLAPEFRTAAWRAYLHERGLGWFTDAVSYTRDAQPQQVLAWNDYHNIDIVFAVRPYDRKLHPRKPATKLYNAWHAGAPAILGPELAYRDFRRSPLDYIEVSSAEEARMAIERLCNDPELYEAMVRNGERRAQEVTSAALTERWAQLLFETIPPLADDARVRFWRGKPLRAKELSRRTARALGLWK